MPRIDPDKLTWRSGSGYPGQLGQGFDGRRQAALGDPHGITQFGVNIVHLAPGAMSSLRHWHMQQDEFAVVTAGECTLVDDDGEHLLRPGDCAAFPANDGNGHHLINTSDAPATFVVVGTRTETDTAFYSDLDMKVEISAEGYDFTRKDGSPLTAAEIGEDQ